MGWVIKKRIQSLQIVMPSAKDGGKEVYYEEVNEKMGRSFTFCIICRRILKCPTLSRQFFG